MQLGELSNGVIRTMRYFRGSAVLRNRFDEITVGINPKGGLAVLFEINYNTGISKAAVSVAREDDCFSKDLGKAQCQEKFDAGNVIEFRHDPSFTLMECLYGSIMERRANGEVLPKFDKTVADRIQTYTFMNECAEELFNSICPEDDEGETDD